jgi:hypothetical protein
MPTELGLDGGLTSPPLGLYLTQDNRTQKATDNASKTRYQCPGSV